MLLDLTAKSITIAAGIEIVIAQAVVIADRTRMLSRCNGSTGFPCGSQARTALLLSACAFAFGGRLASLDKTLHRSWKVTSVSVGKRVVTIWPGWYLSIGCGPDGCSQGNRFSVLSAIMGW